MPFESYDNVMGILYHMMKIRHDMYAEFEKEIHAMRNIAEKIIFLLDKGLYQRFPSNIANFGSCILYNMAWVSLMDLSRRINELLTATGIRSIAHAWFVTYFAVCLSTTVLFVDILWKRGLGQINYFG